MGIWRVIWRPVWEVSGRVILRPFWDLFWTLSGPYLGNLHKYLRIAFIWPWVGAYLRNSLILGSGRVLGGVPV